MKIQVKVITNSKKEEIKKEGDNYKVHLTAQPVKGKANKALIDLLSKHFKIKKSSIKITKGLSSHTKSIFFDSEKCNSS